MTAGMFSSRRNLGLEIWVAILFFDVTSFIEKIEQRLHAALGSLLTIFAHPEECGPVPGPDQAQKCKGHEPEAAVRGKKWVEIGQAIVEAVAHALDAIKRDFTHGGEARDGRRLHVNEGGGVGCSQAMLLSTVSHFGTGGKPKIAGSGI